MASFIYKGVSWTYFEVTAADGNVWMDRNLGASHVATSSTDTSGYGDLFQWGRLDDSHQIRTSGTTSTLSTGDVPGNSNFIYTSSSPYDWRNPQNNALWQSGLNVPAPAGWHVPTLTELNNLITAESISDAATAYSSTLKLTVGGKRQAPSALLTDVGSWGYYWSSSATSTQASHVYFYPSGINTYARNRADAYSVRLIKDAVVPFTPSPMMHLTQLI